MNKRYRVSKSSIHGKGLFAVADIKRGALVGHIKGKWKHKVMKSKEDSLATADWIGVSKYYWIDPGPNGDFKYINHSCDPNAGLKGEVTLIALRDIKKGEEITLDYSTTEADTFWEMTCACKTALCRKKVTSIHSLSPGTFKKYMPYIPRYFQKVYIRNYLRKKVEEESSRKEK